MTSSNSTVAAAGATDKTAIRLSSDQQIQGGGGPAPNDGDSSGDGDDDSQNSSGTGSSVSDLRRSWNEGIGGGH